MDRVIKIHRKTASKTRLYKSGVRMAYKGILFFFLWYLVNCRGKELLEKMPPYIGTKSTAIIIFSSDHEFIHSQPRTHLVEMPEQIIWEVARKEYDSFESVMQNPFMAYGNMLINSTGEVAKFSEKEYRYTKAKLSPNNKYILWEEIGNVFVTSISGKKIGPAKTGVSHCHWINSAEIICLSGTHQKYFSIVLFNYDLSQEKKIYEIKTGEKLENLVAQAGLPQIVFTANKEDSVRVLTLNVTGKELTELASFQKKYIFKLALSTSGIIAAKIVHSKQDTDLMHPYNIWISKPFGPATVPGYLLRQAPEKSPGFFFGNGFRGVKDMAFSPNGDSLAILMSQPGDCKMADEGGNLACRENIFLVEKNSSGITQLTKLKMTTARSLEWHLFKSVSK